MISVTNGPVRNLNLAFETLELNKFKHLASERRLKVGVVGFGYIGSCIGAVLAKNGFSVTGIEKNLNYVNAANAGEAVVAEPGLAAMTRESVKNGLLICTSETRAISELDVVLVTVGTPLGVDSNPDLSAVTACAREISQHLQQGQLIILKSTVPPGTTEEVVQPLLESNGLKAGRDFGLVFSPERIAEGSALKELIQIPIVVGGIDEKSTEFARSFWEEGLGVSTYPLESPKSAEMAKLANNLWIDLNIALGNELAQLSDQLGIDAVEMIRAANTLPKGRGVTNILHPGFGVGGPCLTKDPWFVHSLGSRHNLDLQTPRVSREINEKMPLYTVARIKEQLHRIDKSPRDCKIAVIGVSFKLNTGDCRATPTVPIIRELQNSFGEVRVIDPMVKEGEIKEITGLDPYDDLFTAVRDVDCVCLLAPHEEVFDFSFSALSEIVSLPCLVFDGRNVLDVEEIKNINQLGFTYSGVGRPNECFR